MMPMTYRPKNKEELSNKAKELVRQAIAGMDSYERWVFPQYLAVLLANVWPSSHDAELLDAIREQAKKCGA